MSSDSFFENFVRLLELESVAQSQRVAERLARFPDAQAEKSGDSLLDLVIADSHPGLGGKFIVQLMKRNRDQAFPWNRFKVGSPAVLSMNHRNDRQTWQAVVCGRQQNSIEIACNELPDGDLPGGNRLRLDLSSDEVTLRRQAAAMQTMICADGRAAKLRDVMLNLQPPAFNSKTENNNHDAGAVAAILNPSQQRAIELAMSARDVAIIHGPPGTGKTTTVVELIRRLIGRGEKVLATAPSNTAVDNLVDKLSTVGVNVVRLGHPARVSQHLRERSLDLIVENDPSMDVAREMIREAETLFRKADRFTRARPSPGYRRDMRHEARQLKSQARALERHTVQYILDKADVICATLSGDFEVLQGRVFDSAVIDEACQSVEPGCWITVPRCERLFLAGDHCQLPPTVVSQDAAQQGLALSMLERITGMYGETVTTRLETQYRMNEAIGRFSSEHFYDGDLAADESVRSHLLCDLPDVGRTPLTETPLSFIDTAGSGFEEQLEPEGLSKLNPGEATMVIHQLRELLESGVPAESIAVIAPYAAQVRHLRDLTRYDSATAGLEHVEIDTVDGFQGREKEAIVISLTRSNGLGEIGFLADERRMNVAMTRARRKLILIGDSATLGHHEFYKKLLEHVEKAGAYHTVWEYGIIG